MAALTVRTTVAFDPATAARLERLAKRWGVSKAETLRRALELSENAQPAAAAPDFSGMSPLQILDWLRQHPSPPIPGGWGDDPHLEMREMREMDAKIEAMKPPPPSPVKSSTSPAPSAAPACIHQHHARRPALRPCRPSLSTRPVAVDG